MPSVSKEYAKALYELSTSSQVKEEILDNLNKLNESMDEEIRNFMFHPEIKKEEKKNIISNVFEDGLFKDFIFVLIDNDRLCNLEEIKNEYEELINNEKNIVDVIVYSGEKLSKEYIDKLKTKLEKKFDSNLSIRNEIDLKITAGIRIVYDSKEIDLTIDTKMKNFKNELKESL